MLRETAGWLVENPFDPPAADWLILPLLSERAMVGVDLGITVEDYVHAWEPQMRGALARGFGAARRARFPIGPDERIIERSVEYDRAWDEHFRDLPCVSLCLFIVGEIDPPRVAQVGATHDGVLVATSSGPAWA